ncbi:DNA-3-methyladenine glycosylase [Agrococcus sediminis]|uniref:Putative 3-methyladenine DNA glycosylase n=1 Tax=Agrococcus sediminis TaxID=2599924 RepID=A0A5M8Q8D5_9MICO|nr:DNA-3-methyladenine glycosylase [Agrococcus sediminis]KAA6432119.1 DNA-3-methyladenine glycosylase [Agrococcus sediminis]
MPSPDAAWFERDPVELAPLLLGGVLRRADASGAVALRLTEVEAYRGSDDPGAHTFRGKTARNATMFGPGGHVYCYFTYGMHHAVNIVAGPAGSGWGVLVRAGEVVEGAELAAERRHVRRATRIAGELARGPGNVAQALGATLADDGAAFADDSPAQPAGPEARAGMTAAWSFTPADAPPAFRTGPRVGVSGPGGDASAFPWRFWIPGEPSVSAYRAAAPRTRRA